VLAIGLRHDIMAAELAIDARWLHTGIGTYTLNLLYALAVEKNGLRLHAITGQSNLERISPFCDRITVVDTPIYTIREQWQVLWAARRSDLLHVPHYNVPLLRKRKLVTTILDLIHLTDPECRANLAKQIYALSMMRAAAKKADHVITISEYSKSQIVERLKVPPEKVTVIYCSVSDRFSPGVPESVTAARESLGLTAPYLLYVGDLRPYKNIGRLLQAFHAARQRLGEESNLVFVTRDVTRARRLRQEYAGLDSWPFIRFLHMVEDEMLPLIYSGAAAVIMPSLMEGFGLPVLEAMASGAPVICSRAASLPEVGGDAVAYFDPHSVTDLASTMERVCTSETLRSGLAAKGLERAKQFSLQESARKHIDVYYRVLGWE